MDETLVSSTAPDVELHPLACKRLLACKTLTSKCTCLAVVSLLKVITIRSDLVVTLSRAHKNGWLE